MLHISCSLIVAGLASDWLLRPLGQEFQSAMIEISNRSILAGCAENATRSPLGGPLKHTRLNHVQLNFEHQNFLPSYHVESQLRCCWPLVSNIQIFMSAWSEHHVQPGWFSRWFATPKFGLNTEGETSRPLDPLGPPTMSTKMIRLSQLGSLHHCSNVASNTWDAPPPSKSCLCQCFWWTSY